MRRREFITLVGSAAVWPLAAHAQQGERMRRVGVLMGISASDPDYQRYVSAFTQELQNLGWRDGNNLHLEYRFAVGEAGFAQAFAKELVEQHPDVIVAHTTPTVTALMRETHTIPIVFISVADPVGGGFVRSFAAPGGNITGFTNIESSMSGKWLELLKEMSPQLKRVAAIFNPDTAPTGGQFFLRPFEAVAASLAIEPIASPVRNVAEIETAIATLVREPGAGLIVMPDVFGTVHREPIVALAAKYRLPAVYPFRFFATTGGLMSYGVDVVDMWRRAAPYVNRIIRGEKPADLPIQAPTKFQLVLNLKTAKTLGLTIPPTLIALADEVIE
jgi:putative tryptophan/tyrosine transport system substrate-binding protein